LFFSSDPHIERNCLTTQGAIGVPRTNQQSLAELDCKNTTSAEDAPDAREIDRIGVMNLEGGMRRLISH